MFSFLSSFAQKDSVIFSEGFDWESFIDLYGESLSENSLLDLNNFEKFNLNKISFSELLFLPEIDNKTASEIINYRTKNGKFFSIDELLLIDGIDERKLRILKLFFYISDKSSNNDFGNSAGKNKLLNSFYLESGFLNQPQISKGISENKYSGGNYRLFNKFRLNYNDNLKFQFLTDKDAGEKSLVDFYSWSISGNSGIIKKFVVGDFLLNFGQGLTFASALSNFKSSNAIYSVKKKSDGVKENNGLFESGSFRGAAVDIHFGNFSFLPFYSHNLLDANVDSSEDKILTINYSGYHRTESEIDKRSNVFFDLFGGRFLYTNSESYKIELIYAQTIFSKEFKRKSVNGIEGKNFSNFALSYNLSLNNFNTSAEFSYSLKKLALIFSINRNFSNIINWVLLIRNYPSGFVSLFGNAISESGGVENEFGIYNGIRFNTNFGIINSYFDYFYCHTPDYLSNFPKIGNDFLLEFQSKAFNGVDFLFRFKTEIKQTNENINDTSITFNSGSIFTRTNRFRIEINKLISKSLNLRFRTEYCLVTYSDLLNSEKGFLSFIQMDMKFNENIRSMIKLNYFKTDSYNSRIYGIESGLSGYLTNVALYGDGLRWVTGIIFSLKNYLNLYINFSRTVKNGIDKIGSGYDEINSNSSDKISFLLNMKL